MKSQLVSFIIQSLKTGLVQVWFVFGRTSVSNRSSCVDAIRIRKIW